MSHDLYEAMGGLMRAQVQLAHELREDNRATRQLLERLQEEFSAHVSAEQQRTRSNARLWVGSATSLLVALIGALAIGWKDYTSDQCRQQASEVARIQSLSTLDEARSVARSEGTEAGRRATRDLLAERGVILAQPMNVSQR